jgi:RNA recognition motif-containing protein
VSGRLAVGSRFEREESGTERFLQMAKNIYVGNLPWETTADDLLALFQEHGRVARAQVITDRETGRSRGFGFVEMEDDEEAQRAVDALNGQSFKGRPLTVNEARPREDRGGMGGGMGGGRGGGGFGRGGNGGGGGRPRRY